MISEAIKSAGMYVEWITMNVVSFGYILLGNTNVGEDSEGWIALTSTVIEWLVGIAIVAFNAARVVKIIKGFKDKKKK